MGGQWPRGPRLLAPTGNIGGPQPHDRMVPKASNTHPQTANDKDLRTGGKYKKKYYTVKFTQTNMKYKCKGTKKHNWSASSIGRLRYQGRTLWARVTSPILSVPCGPH